MDSNLYACTVGGCSCGSGNGIRFSYAMFLLPNQRCDNQELSLKYLQEVLKRLKTEQASCMELLESEPDRSRCKWPLQSLAYILRQQRSLGETIAQSELQDIYQELTSIDPYRAGYYKDALQS